MFNKSRLLKCGQFVGLRFRGLLMAVVVLLICMSMKDVNGNSFANDKTGSGKSVQSFSSIDSPLNVLLRSKRGSNSEGSSGKLNELKKKCNNGKPDQCETDLDCGGDCVAVNKLCGYNKKCKCNSDCESKLCQPNKKCAAPPPPTCDSCQFNDTFTNGGIVLLYSYFYIPLGIYYNGGNIGGFYGNCSAFCDPNRYFSGGPFTGCTINPTSSNCTTAFPVNVNNNFNATFPTDFVIRCNNNPGYYCCCRK